MRKYMTLGLLITLVGFPASVNAQDWQQLLKKDGLKEWAYGGSENAITAKDGVLTIEGPGQLFYTGPGEPPDFRNFELKVEVLTQPGGRGGVAFHLSPKDPRGSGGFEVRLDNSYSSSRPGENLLKSGSLVWLRPVPKSIVPDDEWFSVHIAVRVPRVQVWVDKQLVADYVEPAKVEVGPKLKTGTIALRGHGGNGSIQFRNVQMKTYPQGETKPSEVKMDETDVALAQLREQAFSIVDFHSHLRGGYTLEKALERMFRTGIGAGAAVNVGVGFPITNDKGAEAYLKEVQGKPVFVGIQAEGREWPKLLSPDTIARFDYVFTDAMTIVDHRGKRARLWIKEEVDIPDPEAFMELLVKTIEGIMDREPIDFYANPTYLPAVIAKDYDKLWTPERQRRVVAALARNKVAMEISNSLHLPKPALIKLAKQAGVRFTFGTNNKDANLGRLEYCLRMIEECALTPDDLWAPKPDGRKPIQVRKPQ